jgi:hypothetical protein
VDCPVVFSRLGGQSLAVVPATGFIASVFTYRICKPLLISRSSQASARACSTSTALSAMPTYFDVQPNAACANTIHQIAVPHFKGVDRLLSAFLHNIVLPLGTLRGNGRHVSNNAPDC